MIWEVDENLDNLIDFDEFQLTYFRNISDITGKKPILTIYIYIKILLVRNNQTALLLIQKYYR